MACFLQPKALTLKVNVFSQMKAKSGAATASNEEGLVPSPSLPVVGDTVGTPGRWGWGWGGALPYYIPRLTTIQQVPEASLGDTCPCLGWRPAFGSWPLPSQLL